MNSYKSVDPNEIVIASQNGVCNCLSLRQKVCGSFTRREKDYAAYQYVSFIPFPDIGTKKGVNVYFNP